MSKRSYTACYLHLIWAVKDRMPLLNTEKAVKSVTGYLHSYLNELGIYVHALYINPEHIHLLIDLPTNRTIEDIVKLIKGSSSHWINQNNIIEYKFAWSVGYAAFAVSKSNVEKVAQYILNQKEHHRRITFAEEYRKFIREYEKE